MRAGKIALILIVVLCAMNWIRAGGNATPLPATFPGLGGHGQPPLYIGAGIVMLIIAARGLARLQRTPKDEDAADEPESATADEDQDDHPEDLGEQAEDDRDAHTDEDESA